MENSGDTAPPQEYDENALDPSIFNAQDEDGNYVVTPRQARQIAHRKFFGRRNTSARTRVTPFDGTTKPMENTQRADWKMPLPPAHVATMLNGFRPAAMEDKWFIYADGHVEMHMHRSWTGKEVIDLAIEFSEHKDLEGEFVAEIQSIAWDAMVASSEEYAKYIALEGFRWVLNARVVDCIVEPKEWDDLPPHIAFGPG